jgi:uncharacterized OB-fold protein
VSETLSVLPEPDRDSRPYFLALARGEFIMQECADCNGWTWPARPICSRCRSFNLQWREASGLGTVYSWIVVHHAFMPAFQSLIPYTVAMVRVDEQDDIFIPGRLIGTAPLDLTGLRVRAVADVQTSEIGLLTWSALT